MAEHREMSEDELRARTRTLLEEIHPEKSSAVDFRRKQFEHGLAWVHFPEGYGGLGLNPKMNLIVHDEIRKNSKVVHEDPPASPDKTLGQRKPSPKAMLEAKRIRSRKGRTRRIAVAMQPKHWSLS